MSALATIHVGLKQLGIAEEDARDIYERQTGERSLRVMTPAQQQAVVDELRRLGFKRASTTAKGRLDGPYAKKLQALWIGAWNLGLVRDRTDAALTSFVRRQTGLDHTRFLRDAAAAKKAIEAIKAWMERDGGVDWSDGNHLPAWQRMPGAKIAIAQWHALYPGERFDFEAFRRFVEDHAFNPLPRMTFREWQGAMNTLGTRIRNKAG